MARIGCGVHADHIPAHIPALFELPVIELENYLYPGFGDEAPAAAGSIAALLAEYSGDVFLSGPYIDLNPGSPERLALEATRTRYAEAGTLARRLGARQIIYLSTFIPIIYLPAYEEDWVARSIAFWRDYMESVDPGVTVALCNTFEFHPDHLVRIVEGVGRPTFRLAFDLGHFLVYGRIPLTDWLERIGLYCANVYVHSNDGQMDTHDPPYVGRLTAEQVAQVAASVPPDAAFILKMADKDAIPASLDWLRAALAG